MLSKIHRLTRKKDFENVFKKGKGARGDFLSIKILEGSKTEVRFGFVVSRKVAGKAVVRNKIRRRLKAAVFSLLKNVKKPTDAVIVAHPGIVDKNFAQMKEKIETLLKGLRAI